MSQKLHFHASRTQSPIYRESERMACFFKYLVFSPAPVATRPVAMVQASSSQNELGKTWSTLATSPPTASAAQYSMMSIASSPPPISFKCIQDQEERAHDALRQISNKSLETIQVGLRLAYTWASPSCEVCLHV